MRPGEHGSRGLQTVIAAILIAALIFATALATFLPANEDTLRVHLGTLETSVAEGLTLARADDEGRVTRAFYDVEMELLREDAEKTASGLISARAEAPLRPRFAEGAALARMAARRLHDLAVPGASAESVVAAQATLAGIRARLDAMKRELDSASDSTRPSGP